MNGSTPDFQVGSSFRQGFENFGSLNFTYLTTNGVRLHTALSGPADGKLVILLHGFPEFWYGWREQIAPMADAGFRVAAPDQRGYNLSDKPRGVRSYAVTELAKDAVGLADALGRETFFLAGHDWGAAVAWQTALSYPQRVKKLAILNVPHPDVMSRTLRSSFKQLLKSWYIIFFQIPGLPEALLSAGDFAGLGRMLAQSGKHGGTPTFTAADLLEYKQAWAQPGALTGMINWYRGAMRSGMAIPSATPRRVSVPTLMLWGRNDIALSAEMAQPSVELCDDGRLVFFDRATHWVQHDEAEAVTKELKDFFKV